MTYHAYPASFRTLALLTLCVLCAFPETGTARVKTAAAPARSSPSSPFSLARTALADHGPTFVETGGRFRYLLKGHDRTVGFAARGVTFSLDTAGDVGIEFPGADPSATLAGRGRSGVKTSVFEGPRPQWVKSAASYSSLAYSGLWPGIDLVYHTGKDRLKYEFHLAPQADPSRIRLAYRGTRGLSIDAAGNLEIATPAGTWIDEAPVAWQISDGKRITIPARFEIFREPERDCYGFTLGEYDASLPLVIDPAILVYSGFLGGTSADAIADVAAGPDGSLYVVGTTASAPDENFPVMTGPDLTFNPEGLCTAGGQSLFDVFVAKIKSDGSGLEYCGYIGGRCNQFGTDIAVDSAGNVYVTGVTASDASTFPVTVGPDLTHNGGTFLGDAFVAKISPDGTDLLFCGYIGGGDEEQANAIAVDAAGNVYVAGQTRSAAGFPVLGGPGGAPPTANFVQGFISKVKPDGSGLVYSGFVGGDVYDEIVDIAVAADGAVYMAGVTSSDAGSLPVVGGPRTAFGGGASDGFAGKLRPDGSGFAWLGYVGGANNDGCSAIAVDSAGNAYVAGVTTSDETSFPVTAGPDLTFNNSATVPDADAFVAKIPPDGLAFAYCGYIGGTGNDAATAIAVTSSGAAVVVGETTSAENTFPVVDGPDLTFNGAPPLPDAFVARVRVNGSGLDLCGYVGGSESDAASGVALDTAGDVYLAGGTLSTETTFPVLGGPVLVNRGFSEAFVAKISTGPPGPLVTSAVKQGKKLVVTGENFNNGAQVLVNGTPYKTKRDNADPTRKLKSGKAGKIIQPGDKVKVRNGDGRESNEVTFSG